jgi:hypothetical protein
VRSLIAEEQMELQKEDCQEEEREQRFVGEHMGTGKIGFLEKVQGRLGKTCALSTVTS